MNEFQKLFLDILVNLDMVYSLNGKLVYHDIGGTRGIDDLPSSPDEVNPYLWGDIFMRAAYLNPSLFQEMIPDKAFEIPESFVETFWNVVGEVANRRIASQS